MNQVQANRLVALMNVMQTIPPKAFDIDSWLNYGAYEAKAKVGSQKVELKCGTTGCAVGWAAVSVPSWKKAFKFTPTGGMYTTLKDDKGQPFSDEFIAIAYFLGISQTEADSMFADGGYEEEHDKFHEMHSWNDDFKVTKPMLFRHCKKVLNDHGYVWSH